MFRINLFLKANFPPNKNHKLYSRKTMNYSFYVSRSPYTPQNVYKFDAH